MPPESPGSTERAAGSGAASSALVDPSFPRLAERLADLGREIALRYFRTALKHVRKGDDSPVTRADREAESAMRAQIAATFPDHGIVGEEHGAEGSDRRFVWVLDPIDGTKSFITGKPLFGCLIALLERGVPRLGVIEMPALEQRWLGVAGRPSVENGAPCATSEVTDLSDARLGCTSLDMFTHRDRALVDGLGEQVWFRSFGADCFGYGQLASGYLDIVVEADLQPWDFLAVVPVVEGAGGTITDWAGAPLGLGSDGRVLAAANPTLHARALARLRGQV